MQQITENEKRSSEIWITNKQQELTLGAIWKPLSMQADMPLKATYQQKWGMWMWWEGWSYPRSDTGKNLHTEGTLRNVSWDFNAKDGILDGDGTSQLFVTVTNNWINQLNNRKGFFWLEALEVPIHNQIDSYCGYCREIHYGRNEWKSRVVVHLMTRKWKETEETEVPQPSESSPSLT